MSSDSSDGSDCGNNKSTGATASCATSGSGSSVGHSSSHSNFSAASAGATESNGLCVVPVGLPARGKSYMSIKLGRYLRWLGIRTEVFSVGAYRRRMFGRLAATLGSPAADDVERRQQAADTAVADMMRFLAAGGRVAIYDDTMTISADLRDALAARLAEQRVHLLFVEAICEVTAVIEANVREVKICCGANAGDPAATGLYVGWEPAAALRDYMAHIDRLRPAYHTLSSGAGGVPPSSSYIQVTNMGVDEDFAEHIVASNVRGYLQTRILLFLLNLHIASRTIYLLPSAPVDANKTFRDDEGLDAHGVSYACAAGRVLGKLLREHQKQQQQQQQSSNETGATLGPKWRAPRIFASTRRDSRETAQHVAREVGLDAEARIQQKAPLVRLNPGAVDGLSDEAVREKYPDEYERHKRDPFKHRYPRGESYYNLAVRIENVILELEDEKADVIVVAHVTVLRCLYAYLMDIPDSQIPSLQFPASTLIELAPDFYGSKKVIHHEFQHE